MSRNDLLIVVALPLVAALLAVTFGVVLPKLRRRRRGSIPVVIAPFEASAPVPPRPSRAPSDRSAARSFAPTENVRTTEGAAAPKGEPHATPLTEARPPRPTAPARGNLAVVSSSDLAPTAGTAQPPAEATPAETARPRLEVVTAETNTVSPARPVPHRPRTAVEGTLQFLPGRLEIIEGRDVGQEVRFVRTPGTPTTEVTFGRLEGEPYRHVQLHEPTVSRLHAKITQEDRRWRLTNLSGTNPVVVNATPLEGEGASVVLSEGDRIEMGEVVFRFRAK